MELTKEYFDEKFNHFDQKLSNFVTKDDFNQKLDNFITKDYLDKRLAAQTAELKEFSKDQTEELARMVSAGFEHVDFQLQDIVKRLDVRDKIQEFDQKFSKLEDTLHIKL